MDSWIKKFSSPKMRNREFVFTPKIEYQLVAERSEATSESLTFPIWCARLDSNQEPSRYKLDAPPLSYGRDYACKNFGISEMSFIIISDPAARHSFLSFITPLKTPTNPKPFARANSKSIKLSPI